MTKTLVERISRLRDPKRACAPTCAYCGKPLRRYRYRQGRRPTPGDRRAIERGDGGMFEDEDPNAQWGGYGDNLFCGKTCGWRWALWHIRKTANEQKEVADEG